MATWPSSSLGDKPMYEGYAESLPDVLVRSQVDAGVDKVRRRYTAGVRPIAMQLTLSSTQVDDLDAFFVTTLKHGAERFDWKHPRTCSTAEFRFTSPPRYEPISATHMRTRFTLELLP